MCSPCQAASPSEEKNSCSTAQGFVGRFCILLVRLYQNCISPFLPPTCRYTPTCSQYAVDAISRYGVFRGVAMAIWRLLRCHPFARGGYDPVP